MSLKAYSQGSTFPPTQPGVLRIYSMRFCPYAQRTRLVLQHKNIPYEEVNINLKSKPDWFLELNPLGQVPVLQIDDQVIPESTATCDWLDDVYPENRLQPTDPYLRAWDRVLLEYISKFSATYYGALRSTDPAELQSKTEETRKHLQFYEDKLKARGDGPYFAGSKPGMFDFLFWPMVERFPVLASLRDISSANIDPDKFPTLTAWVEAMKTLPAAKDTGFETEQFAEFIKGFLNGTPDYDLFL